MNDWKARTWTPGFGAAVWELKIWEGVWDGPEAGGSIICDLDAVDNEGIVPLASG